MTQPKKMALRRRVTLGALGALCAAACPGPLWAAATGTADLAGGGAPWWIWPLALFVACFLIGIVAVPSGIGGGTLFVPVVGSFFPFHLDFVRGAGLLVALASALAAAPLLLRGGLASLRVALPLALLASIGSVFGALIGLALNPDVVQILLGLVVLAMVGLFVPAQAAGAKGGVRAAGPRAGAARAPGAAGAGAEVAARPDALAQALGLNGHFIDGATGQTLHWQARRTLPALFVFLGIGVLAGLFGIGAGWANVPALHLLMGLPMKVAAGTSGLALALAGPAPAWVYLQHGAVLPAIAAPSVAGMMIGARLGARLLGRLDAAVVRRLVIVLLVFAGTRALLKGTGLWP